MNLFFRNKTIYLIVVIIVTFFIGMLNDGNIYYSNYSTKYYSNFQEVFYSKEKKLDTLVSKVGSIVNNNSIISVFNNDFNFDNNEYGILVFDKNELKYWSSNSIPIDEMNIQNLGEENVLKFKNGWYYIKKYSVKSNIDILGLILIKNVYSFENEFIKSEYSKDFEFPSNVKISTNSSEGKPIYNSEKKYVFSLLENDDVYFNILKKYLSAIFYFISIFLCLIFIKNILWKVIRNDYLKLIILGVILLIVRCLMLKYRIPLVFYEIDLFQPHHFATSSFIPSLGDLLLHSVFLVYLLNIFYFRFYPKIVVKKRQFKYFVSFLLLLLTSLLFLVLVNLFKSLIINSSISFTIHKFFDLSIYSLIAYLIIILLLLVFYLFSDKLIIFLGTIINIKEYVLLSTFVTSIIFLLSYFYLPIDYLSIIFYFSIIVFLGIGRYYYSVFKYSYTIFVILLFSIFSVFFILKNTKIKENETKKVLVVNLANERDQIAEMLLSSVDKKISQDTVIRDLLPGYLENEGTILDQLRKKYFSGYFRKYDIQISICNPNDELTLLEDNSSDVVQCYSFFNDMLNDGGVYLNVSNFYFLDNQNGSISYIGQIKYNKPEWGQEMSLFISLDSKLINEELGYPELLLNNKLLRQKSLNNYSYAKYRNGNLITKSGEYVYMLSLPSKWNSKNEFEFVEGEDFEHLIYNYDKKSTIVISKQKLSVLDFIAFFSYIFVFYYLIIIIALFVINFPDNIRNFNYDFKNKIKFSMIGVLLLSLIIVGTITVYYNVVQYEKTLNENIGEKTQSVLVELEHKLGGEESINSDYSEYLTYLLTKFSNVFYIDINIYDINGSLLASSRPQIFEKGLMGRKMNVDAYKNVALNNLGRYIHKEKIGSLSYYSAYVPFYNDENKLLAYLNLPYFTKQSAMKKGIYTLVVAFVNIYFFLIFLSIVLAVFISNNITKPLKLIQNKFKEIDLKALNQQIDYKSNDEIGSLIKEYNRMLSELSVNAEKLARSERETAWREMAKQIAHEIKNPLTPMKLSVQYLQRARNENVEDFDQKLKKFSKSMIEQINSLSSIATAFSNFAKMPKTKNTKIDLLSIINNTVNLFQSNQNIEISIKNENIEQIVLFADREQLIIVVRNLLQNAIQAIPENRKGQIVIKISKLKNKALVEICDNGDGITDDIKNKLFTPNFTTKSSGMGLGLAIVKNIVENANGKIWFSTKLNYGTSFYLSFPLYE